MRSTGAAATLWIAGTGSRLVFALYAEHGGAEGIGRLSQAWEITSPTAWSTGLLLMSLFEVGGRASQLAPRLRRARRAAARTNL